MFLDRNDDTSIVNDKPIGGGNYGAMDFSTLEEKIPDWLNAESEEFLPPGALKQEIGEVDDASMFLTDTPQDQYTDGVTRRVIEFDPERNPTFTAGRGYLLADKSDLIRDAAAILKDVMETLRPAIFSRQPVLSKIITEDVQPDGHVLTGEAIWTIELSAANTPGIRKTQQSTPVKKMRVEVPIKIRDGRMAIPKIFYTASSRPYPLTMTGCQLALHWHERPLVRKRMPTVDIAQGPEHDYRAF